jgi:hypothetical protein
MTTEDFESLEAEQGWNPGMTSAEIQDVAVAVDKLATEIFPELGLHGCRCSLCHRLEDKYNKCAQRMERIAEEIREHIAHRTQAREDQAANQERYAAEFWASGSYTVRELNFWQTPYQLPHYTGSN